MGRSPDVYGVRCTFDKDTVFVTVYTFSFCHMSVCKQDTSKRLRTDWDKIFWLDLLWANGKFIRL